MSTRKLSPKEKSMSLDDRLYYEALKELRANKKEGREKLPTIETYDFIDPNKNYIWSSKFHICKRKQEDGKEYVAINQRSKVTLKDGTVTMEDSGFIDIPVSVLKKVIKG